MRSGCGVGTVIEEVLRRIQQLANAVAAVARGRMVSAMTEPPRAFTSCTFTPIIFS